MDIVLWIVQVVLALLFIFAGVLKAFQYERARAQLPWVKDVPRNLVTFIGIAELLGGLGLILPAVTGILPWLTPLAALGLAIIMVLATGFHIQRRETTSAVFTFILLVVVGFVAYGRWMLAPV